MGYIKHNAVIVTGWEIEKIEKSKNKAIEIFESNLGLFGKRMISEVVEGIANGQYSFFIAPDGSKEGWEASDNGDNARKEFMDWLQKDPDNYCDYIEVRFGGDDEYENIERSKDKDLNNEH